MTRAQVIKFVLAALLERFGGQIPEWAQDAAAGVLADLLDGDAYLAPETRLVLQERLDTALHSASRDA